MASEAFRWIHCAAHKAGGRHVVVPLLVTCLQPAHYCRQHVVLVHIAMGWEGTPKCANLFLIVPFLAACFPSQSQSPTTLSREEP